jgi:hypothetical protein
MEESPERLCRYTVMLPVDGQQLQLNVVRASPWAVILVLSVNASNFLTSIISGFLSNSLSMVIMWNFF